MWYTLLMKKITCFVSDSNLLETIQSFCEKERFSVEALESLEDFEYDAASVIYITDNAKNVCLDKLKDMPVCCVGDEKIDCRDVFVLAPDFKHIHLRCLVDAVTHSGCFEAAAVAAVPQKIKKSFKISNDIFNIEKVVFALTKDFVYFLDFNSLEKIRVGLSEMLTNAIEHGNLGITGDDKLHATENGTYYDLVNERLSDNFYTDRRVSFEYEISDEGIYMQIEDEGEGFDVNNLPDPTDPESLLKLHGRGILITRMYFEELKYNDKGNQVTLSKRF
jgi:anti-sigma regulatory factor (Ser/Thr protein kinase)